MEHNDQHQSLFGRLKRSLRVFLGNTETHEPTSPTVGYNSHTKTEENNTEINRLRECQKSEYLKKLKIESNLKAKLKELDQPRTKRAKVNLNDSIPKLTNISANEISAKINYTPTSRFVQKCALDNNNQHQDNDKLSDTASKLLSNMEKEFPVEDKEKSKSNETTIFNKPISSYITQRRYKQFNKNNRVVIKRDNVEDNNLFYQPHHNKIINFDFSKSEKRIDFSKITKTNQPSFGSSKESSTHYIFGNWNCANCKETNLQKSFKFCPKCGSLNPTLKSNESFTKSNENWICGRCQTTNKYGNTTCNLCLFSHLLPNKDNLSSTKTIYIDNDNSSKSHFSSINSRVNSSSKYVKSVDKWNCPACSVDNDKSVDNCVCCGTKNSDYKESHSTTSIQFGSVKNSNPFNFGSNSSGKWNCPSCSVDNDKSADKCVCCTTKNPGIKDSSTARIQFGSSNSLKSTPTHLFETKSSEHLKDTNKIVGEPQSTSSIQFGSVKNSNSFTTYKFGVNSTENKSNKWNCPTCFVDNDKSANECVCCATKNPEIKQSNSQSSIIFGSLSNSKPTSTIKFGFKQSENNVDVSKVDKWNCPTCSVDNDSIVKECVCCGTTNPGIKISQSSSINLGSNNLKPSFVFGSNSSENQKNETKGDRWNCPTCSVDNEKSVDKCVCCATKNPDINVSISTPILFGSTKNSNSTSTFKFGSNSTEKESALADKWNCSTCSVDNNKLADKCVCCATKNPQMLQSSTQTSVIFGSTSNSNPTIMFGSKPSENNIGVSKDEKWNCPTCCVDNDKSANKCVCCATKNPIVKDSTSTSIQFGSSTTIKSVPGFKFGSTPSENNIGVSKDDKWNCPTCSVDNDKSANECVCCATKNPEIKQTNSQSSIIFGSLSNSKPTSTIKFGSKPSENVIDVSKVDKWNCPTCSVDNDKISHECVCCGTKNPEKKDSCSKTSVLFDSLNNSKPISTIMFGSNLPKENTPKITFGQSNDTWNCPTCSVDNAKSLDKCACCATSNPEVKGSVITSSIQFGLSKSTTSITFGSTENKTEESICFANNDKPLVSCNAEKLLSTKQSDFNTIKIDQTLSKCQPILPLPNGSILTNGDDVMEFTFSEPTFVYQPENISKLNNGVAADSMEFQFSSPIFLK